MIKVYKINDTIVTVNVTPKFKEVTVSSNMGSQLYSAPLNENGYGTMGSYVDSWLQTVEGLEPVVVVTD